MSIITNPNKVYNNFKEHVLSLYNSVKHYLPSSLFGKIEPAAEAFIEKYAGADGKLVWDECNEAVEQLRDGQKTFSEVMQELLTDLLVKSPTLAKTDVGEVLLIIQGALQIAKGIKGILTPADKAIVLAAAPIAAATVAATEVADATAAATDSVA